jgi:uncharacterized protein YbaR (Trm112 family)
MHLPPSEERPIKLTIIFVCPNCKAKIEDAYLLWNEKEKQYTTSYCTRCEGVFELQLGLDPKWIPPIR